MPQNYSDAQGTVYDWRTGRPISGKGGVGSIPPSRVPPSGRPTSSRAPLGGTAPRSRALSPQTQSGRINQAWGTVPDSANGQGFGYLRGSTASYSDAQGREYNAATGRPMSGISGVGAIPPSPQTPAPSGGGAPRPPAAPPRQAPLAAPPRQAPPAAAPVRSAPMPGFGTPRVEIRAGGRRAAALNNQAQQAGSPARYASVGDDVRLAQDTRSGMVRSAREAGNEVPANLTPASESYWNDADIRAWAQKNKGLANQLRRKNGLPDLDANGQAPWAAPNVTWSGGVDRNPSLAYGMQNNLAPGAAQAGAAMNVPAQTWNGPDQSALGFNPDVNLSAPERFRAPASTWNMQSNFNPGLDLGTGYGQPGDFQGSSSVPVASAYSSGMDLMGQGTPTPPSGVAATSYGVPGAQDFSQGALAQVRKMKGSYGSAGRLNFNPQSLR